MRLQVFAVTCLLMMSEYCLAQPENSGPHQAGWTQQTIQRSGRSLNCRIYYPSFVEGSEAQIDTLNGVYPIVAFGHGFAMQTSYYLSLFRHLSTHGYVVIAPQFPDTQHGQLADDLLYCVEYIRQQFSAASSRFYRLVDTSSVGLSGHSMGGGASVLAAARDARVDVVAPLAAAETNPSAIAVTNQIAGVVYLISGGSDGITPTATNQFPMYNNARSLKALPIILQANHTRFLDVATFDFTDPNGTLTRPQQLLITRRYLTSVFNLVLKKDTSYWKFAIGDSAIADARLNFSRQLRSIAPLPFSLVSPQGSTTTPVRFVWRKASSLNPSEQILYSLQVASTQAFADTVAIVNNLADTTALITASLLVGRQYFWRVVARSSDSTSTISTQSFPFTLNPTSVEEASQPIEFSLAQNFPNPFNPTTTMSFVIGQSSFVSLRIFDVLGRIVATLVNERLNAGAHNVQWSAANSTSGVYLYRLTVDGQTKSKRMLLIK